jgi:hypothetical protein
MNITLRLNAEVERRLQGEAARNGLTLVEYIEQLAERSVASDPGGSAVSSEAWEMAWRSWASSHKTLPSAVDDDRDSIYAERGE